MWVGDLSSKDVGKFIEIDTIMPNTGIIVSVTHFELSNTSVRIRPGYVDIVCKSDTQIVRGPV